MFKLLNLSCLKTTQGRLANYAVGKLGQHGAPTRRVASSRVSSHASRPLSRRIAAMHPAAVQRVVEAFGEHSIGAFLLTFLSNPSYADSPLRHQFIAKCTQLLAFLCSLSYLSPTVTAFCLEFVIKLLTSEVRELVKKQTGWHFSAHNAQPEPIPRFSLAAMAQKLEEWARARQTCIWNRHGRLPNTSRVRARISSSVSLQGMGDGIREARRARSGALLEAYSAPTKMLTKLSHRIVCQSALRRLQVLKV